ARSVKRVRLREAECAIPVVCVLVVHRSDELARGRDFCSGLLFGPGFFGNWRQNLRACAHGGDEHERTQRMREISVSEVVVTHVMTLRVIDLPVVNTVEQEPKCTMSLPPEMHLGSVQHHAPFPEPSGDNL